MGKSLSNNVKLGKNGCNSSTEIETPAVARTWITAYDTPYWDPYVTYDGKMLSEQIQGLYDAGLVVVI